MDCLVGEKLAMYETAGALCSGRRVWLLARIPGEFRAGADDVILYAAINGTSSKVWNRGAISVLMVSRWVVGSSSKHRSMV